MGNSSTVRLMVELFPIFYTSNQNLTFRKIGNSSTISLTVELFPIYAFELFPIYAIRNIYAFPNLGPIDNRSSLYNCVFNDNSHDKVSTVVLLI